MSEPLLEIEDLSISLKEKTGEKRLVRGVDFSVPESSILGIIGESGSGKSLSMKAIMSILPSKVEASFENFVFQGQAVTDVRQLPISMIFQDPMTSLNPLRKVGYQVIEVIRRHQGLSKEEAFKEGTAMLEQVGIRSPEKRMNQYPFELSGGMRQRVMIAMALLVQPALLIADEPTTALDVTVQAQILSLIKELQEKKKLSVILVSHDFGVIAGMCDYIKVMYQGRVVEEGLAEEIFYDARHIYTQELLKAADLNFSSSSLADLDLEQGDWDFDRVSPTHRYLKEV